MTFSAINQRAFLFACKQIYLIKDRKKLSTKPILIYRHAKNSNLSEFTFFFLLSTLLSVIPVLKLK